MRSAEGLVSCDTFVVMGDMTSSKEIIFGKNSDRPKGEVQEVVVVEPGSYQPGTKLQAGKKDRKKVNSVVSMNIFCVFKFNAKLSYLPPN